MLDLPEGRLPQVLPVTPSPPETVEHDRGRKTVFRVGNIAIGAPIYIDFPTIFQCLAELPDARSELTLSTLSKETIDPYLYPSESQQLSFLIDCLDDEYPQRLQRRLNPRVASTTGPRALCKLGMCSPPCLRYTTSLHQVKERT